MRRPSWLSTTPSANSACALSMQAAAIHSYSVPICGRSRARARRSGDGTGGRSGDCGGANEGIRRARIDTFICSGYPHLEEAYRVAELLFPHLPLRSDGDEPSHARAADIQGEMIGTKRFPAPRAKQNSLGQGVGMKKWLNGRWAPWLLPIAAIALWQATVSLGWLSNRYLPAPSEVLAAARRLMASGELFQYLGVSAAPRVRRAVRWRTARVWFRANEWPAAGRRTISRYYVGANDSQRSAPGVDSAGDLVVWNRRGSEAVFGLVGRVSFRFT